MTQQAKDILLQVAADTETMYNQGVLDGITLIKNMLSEQPEDTEWTIDLVIETCDAFIEKYTNSEDGLPDIPNLMDEVPVPEEAKEAGMTSDDYGDLMAFLNENKETAQEEEKAPEMIPLDSINGVIVEDESDYEKFAHNNLAIDSPHVPVIIGENDEITAIPVINKDYELKSAVDVECVPVETLSPTTITKDMVGLGDIGSVTPETPIAMNIDDVLANAVICTQDGEEIKLADCIAEVEDSE